MRKPATLAALAALAVASIAIAQIVTPPTPPPAVQPSVVEVQDCHYVIYGNVEGYSVLLDQCSGRTWRYDEGFDYATRTQARVPSWAPVVGQ